MQKREREKKEMFSIFNMKLKNKDLRISVFKIITRLR